ncbi:MAG TPA: hypothetical protein VLY65_02105, partial [Nitrososphaerales archaeon]|nr:hypothetical protein [Nitrososphaerales archaeon]
MREERESEAPAVLPDPPSGADAPASSIATQGEYIERHPHIAGRGLISASALGLADGLVTNLAFLTGFSGAVSGDA